MYQRLAMGGSHSVHVIMSINLHAIGRALISKWAMLEDDSEVSTSVGDAESDESSLCGLCSYSVEDGAEDQGELQYDT